MPSLLDKCLVFNPSSRVTKRGSEGKDVPLIIRVKPGYQPFDSYDLCC